MTLLRAARSMARRSMRMSARMAAANATEPKELVRQCLSASLTLPAVWAALPTAALLLAVGVGSTEGVGEGGLHS